MNYYINPNDIGDVSEKVQVELLGMVELYDANMISYDELMRVIDRYDKQYSLRREYLYDKQYDQIYYAGVDADQYKVYYLPVHQPRR